MAEYALVSTEIVKAVIVADSDFISASGDAVKSQLGFAGGAWVLTPSKVGKGWSYISSAFASPTKGKSVSGATPATAVSADDTLMLNINGDGAQTVNLLAKITSAEIAAEIQLRVRALTAADSSKQAAYSSFLCSVVDGKYELLSGTAGISSVVVTGGTSAADLKLGTGNGGTETAGTGE